MHLSVWFSTSLSPVGPSKGWPRDHAIIQTRTMLCARRETFMVQSIISLPKEGIRIY